MSQHISVHCWGSRATTVPLEEQLTLVASIQCNVATQSLIGTLLPESSVVLQPWDPQTLLQLQPSDSWFHISFGSQNTRLNTVSDPQESPTAKQAIQRGIGDHKFKGQGCLWSHDQA